MVVEDTEDRYFKENFGTAGGRLEKPRRGGIRSQYNGFN